MQVLNATVERMKEKGKTVHRLEEKFGNAKQLMNQMNEQFGEPDQEQLKGLMKEAKENLGGVGRTIREINKSNKGGNAKGKGKNGN